MLHESLVDSTLIVFLFYQKTCLGTLEKYTKKTQQLSFGRHTHIYIYAMQKKLTLELDKHSLIFMYIKLRGRPTFWRAAARKSTQFSIILSVGVFL